MGTPEKGTSELHPHFPCEGTPSHADSCDQPKPLAVAPTRQANEHCAGKRKN